MGLRDQIHSAGNALSPSNEAQYLQETAWAPSPGTYLTDGAALFRVQDALFSRDELLLELEDCSTFELVLCPASMVGGLALRRVTPAEA